MVTKTRQQWPALNTKAWPIAKLKRYDKNPRTHPPEQRKVLKQLLLQFGWTMPALIDPKDAVLIAGHGRLDAAEELVTEGHEQFKMAPVAQAIGWTKKEKTAYRIADNQSALMSQWNEQLLIGEIIQLQNAGGDLTLLGFDNQQLIDLGVPNLEASGGELGGEDRHALLRLVDITIDDPKHSVARGDHFLLNERHHLIICSPITEWSQWTPLLIEGALLCPWAGVYVPFAVKARDHALIMVQPDPYIAGHILDRYAEVHGKKSIVKQ